MYKIEQVSTGELKKGVSQKTGKDYAYQRVGLKINDKWYNKNVFNKEDVDALASMEGVVTDLITLGTEEHKGNTYDVFEIPRGFAMAIKLEMIERRLDAIEATFTNSTLSLKQDSLPTHTIAEDDIEPPDDDLPF